MRRRTFLGSIGGLATGATGGCLRSGPGSKSGLGSDGDSDSEPGTEPRTRSGSESGKDGPANETLPGMCRNPVFETVFPDPATIRVDGEYFAYATHQEWGDGRERKLIPIARSPNLVDWERKGAALEERPEWATAPGLWAPGIERIDGRYVLYYSVTDFGDPDPCIGVATAQSPTGPFTDRGRVLCGKEIGIPNSIDPCPVVENGRPYLFCGSHGGIYGVPLSADGIDVVGEPFAIAGGGVEAPFILEDGGWYYFFGSRGSCCNGAKSTYHVVVGRSRSLRGPYRNRSGEVLTTSATGTTILQGGPHFVGPGHNCVVRDDAGSEWLVYHAYERSDPWIERTPRRVLMLDPLRWEVGWPVLDRPTPSRLAHRPSARP